jgi:N-acetylglucosamine-6-sulfatase
MPGRRTLPLLLLLTMGATSVAAAPPAGGAPRTTAHPNVVLILTDDQTFDALAPGSPEVMPHLESELADPASGWIGYSNFFFNNPLCCPSRATILTGRYSHHTGVEDNSGGSHLDESSTVATWLDAAGYRTGLVGKYLNDYPFGRGDYKPPGWDYWAVHTGKGNLGYFDYTLFESPDGSSTGTRVDYKFGASDYSTLALTALGTDFIEQTPDGTPFFLDLSLAAAHGDWKPQDIYANAFDGVTPPHDPSFNEDDVSDKPAWVQRLPRLDAAGIAASDEGKIRHYETLRSVDDSVAAIESTLASAGVLDDTVIIFMTDNGYQFAEHRWAGKRCEYDVCLRSPFLVRFPGATSHDDPHLLSNVDVAPTIAALAGATPTISVDGVSFAPLLTGQPPPPWRTGVLIHNAADGSDAVPTWWGVRTADYAYVELAAPADPDAPNVELYDLTGQLGAADPFELQNRALNPEYAAVRAQLAEQLAELQGVDLVTTVSDAPDPVVEGSKLTLTVTVTNAGIGTAYATTLSNPIPAGAALVSATPSQGSCDTSVSCALGAIRGGKKATVSIVVRANQTGSMVDTATASGPAPDPTPANATGSSSTSVTPRTNVADLSVTLTDSPDPVAAGGALTYTAKIANSGPDKATGVTLTEPVPAHTTFVSATPVAACPEPVSGVVTCALGRISPGSSVSVSITVTPTRVGAISATVTVDATSSDVDSADLTASENTTVTDPSADLSLTLSDRPDPITLGSGSITYTIVATNAGPATASGVRIADTLAASVDLISARPGARCSLDARVITCRAGTLAAGASSTVTVVVNPTAVGIVANSAAVSSSNPDPDHSDNTRAVSTTVQPARWASRLHQVR